MASSLDFVQFVCEQIDGCGEVGYKKMFGEYMVYLNQRPIFLICEDTLFVKVLPCTTSILGEDAEQGQPYNGAKSHYIISDLDDREFMQNLAVELEKVTALPKPRKKKE